MTDFFSECLLTGKTDYGNAMPYFFLCELDPTHLSSRHSADKHDLKCPVAGCGGKMKIVRYVSTHAPRAFAGQALTVKVNGVGKKIRANPYRKPRRAREAATQGMAQRHASEQADIDLDDQYGAVPAPAEDATDVAYIGEPTPFRGVHSRLTAATAPYAKRANLDVLVQQAAAAGRILMTPRGAVAEGADRGGGQFAAMDNKSAAQVSQRALSAPVLEGAAGAAAQVANASEEWCHLRAACLGGLTNKANLVAASHACNTYMMVIETFLNRRTDLSLQVTAYCSDADTNVAEAIRYDIYDAQTKLVFSELIDAVAPGFSRSDFDVLSADLRRRFGSG